MCARCHALKDRLYQQRAALDSRKIRRALQAAQKKMDQNDRGLEGVALDYVLIEAGPLPAKAGAARALSEAGLLAV